MVVMLPCCSRPRGIPTGDSLGTEDYPIGGYAKPVQHADACTMGQDSQDVGGGAFLKLRDKLAASKAANSLKDSTEDPAARQPGSSANSQAWLATPHGPGGLLDQGLFSFSLGSPTNTPTARIPSASPGSKGSHGWMNEWASNLGVPIVPSPSTSPSSPPGHSQKSILKTEECRRSPTNSQVSTDSSAYAQKRSSVSTPRSHLGGDVTGRSAASSKSTRRVSSGRGGLDEGAAVGRLPDSETKALTAKVGELVRAKMIDVSAEPALYKMIAQQDAHILIAWTVYQCHGDDQTLAAAFAKRFACQSPRAR